MPKAREKRLTWKTCIDGYEDVGLCEGVTVGEAICKLADIEEAEHYSKVVEIDQFNKWISVKDRLPEQDGEYLVFKQSRGRTNISILWFAKDARKVDKYYFRGRWKNAWYGYDSEWGYYMVGTVTHWKPLPEPPKGE